MSGLEIERKFLVKKGGAYKRAAFSSSRIKQGYIPADGATVRIRVRDDKAYLTIKARSVNGGMTRYEFEKEITLDEADNLLKLCRGGFIDKCRWLVKSGDHTFEVDEFSATTRGWSWQRWSWAARMRLMSSPSLLALRSRATSVSTTLTCSLTPSASGETLCQKNTGNNANGGTCCVGGKVEPVAATPPTSAGGLQNFYQTAHEHWQQPAVEKQPAHALGFVVACFFNVAPFAFNVVPSVLDKDDGAC